MRVSPESGEEERRGKLVKEERRNTVVKGQRIEGWRMTDSSRLTRLNTSAARETEKVAGDVGRDAISSAVDLLTLMWTGQRMSSDWAAINRGTFQFPTRQSARGVQRHVTRVRNYASRDLESLRAGHQFAGRSQTVSSRSLRGFFAAENCHLDPTESRFHRELKNRGMRDRILVFLVDR